jgi:hypothetical protein
MTNDNAVKTHRRRGVGRLAALLCVTVIATLFSIGQATTFAWLSAIPAQASRIESLEWRFWIYVGLTFVLLVVDLKLIWMVLRNVLHRRK